MKIHNSNMTIARRFGFGPGAAVAAWAMRFTMIVLVGAGSLPLPAQTAIPAGELLLRHEAYWPPSLKPLTAEARSVDVGVVVRDSSGHTVAGLTKDDFAIEQDGKRRDITYFGVNVQPSRPPSTRAVRPASQSAASAPIAPGELRPRFLAVVFDDLGMDAVDVPAARIAAGRFFSEGLGQHDQASVLFLSRGQVVPFTSDTGKLKASLAALKPATEIAGPMDCPKISPYESYRITEQGDGAMFAEKVEEAKACGTCVPHDRSCPEKVRMLSRDVWEYSRGRSRRTLMFLGGLAEAMGQLPGQRVIVLASSGFLARTLDQDLEEVVDKAIRAGVVIHALDTKGLYTQKLDLGGFRITARNLIERQIQGTRAEEASNDALGFLADSTGGLFFHNNNDLSLGFSKLGLAPDVSYDLAFTPSGKPGNRYHKLSVHLTARKGLQIQARPGYYDSKASPPPRPEVPMDKEVLTSDTPSEVPAAITASPASGPPGSGALRVVLHLRVGELPFVIQSGLRRLQVDFIAALFDENAGFVSGEVGQALFRLRNDTFRRMGDGLSESLNLNAPPGKYRLRCVVWESNGGKFTAVNQPVEVR